MRTPSRRMPPAPERPMTATSVFIGRLIVSVFIGWVVALCWFDPRILLLVGAFAALSTWATVELRTAQSRLRTMAAEREGESICTFARALDFRAIDTWIIRAVYEELHKACPVLPLRPTDRLGADLLIDEEDLDILAADMAQRAGRQFDAIEENPLISKVETVHDLIRFLAHQPRLAPT